MSTGELVLTRATKYAGPASLLVALKRLLFVAVSAAAAFASRLCCGTVLGQVTPALVQNQLISINLLEPAAFAFRQVRTL